MTTKHKNKSSKIKNGIIIRTRDRYLEGGRDSPDKMKKFPSLKVLYRKGVVVDSNKDDELAIAVYTTRGGREEKNYINTRKIYVSDSNSNPIKIDEERFKALKRNQLSKKEISKLKKEIFNVNLNDNETNNTSKERRRNRAKVHQKLKKR